MHVRLVRTVGLLLAVLVGLVALAGPAAAGAPPAPSQAAPPGGPAAATDQTDPADDQAEPADEPADEPTDQPTDQEGEDPEGGGVSEEDTATCRTANDGYNICVVLVDLENTSDDFPGGTPVEGVTIVVTSPEGVTSEAVTDDGGFAAVPLEGGGDFAVELDEESLPEGVELSDPDQLSLDAVQMLGFSKTVQFPIGLEERVGTSIVDRFIQASYTGLKSGLMIALAALGLSLIFGTTGLTNFAHGELITLGALLTLTANTVLGIPVVYAIPAIFLVTLVIGFGQEKLFWKPLRSRGTGNVALMIVSIGLAILLRNLYQYLWGSDVQAYGEYVTQEVIVLGPLRIFPKELFIIGLCIAVLVAVSLALSKTRIGKATRAVADNPSLAASSGINVSTVIALVWVLGTGLAGLSGALLGLDQGAEFQTGQKILLVVFAAVCLGGLGTIWGAMFGAILVGLFVDVSTLVIPAELKNVAALFALIVILIVKPQGILGRRERVG